MDYEQEDISECLANLFLDKFQIKNEALIVNKFVYHRKTSKKVVFDIPNFFYLGKKETILLLQATLRARFKHDF